MDLKFSDTFKLTLLLATVVGAIEYVVGLYAQSAGDLCQSGNHPLCTPLNLALMTAAVVLLFGTFSIYLLFGERSRGE